MINWLKTEWYSLASKYTEDQLLISRFWQDIFTNYTKNTRFYHDLSHIHNMLSLAKQIEDKITDFNGLRFAIWYHDIIYNATQNDNEEKSAFFAKKHLKLLNIDIKTLEYIDKLILSTKKHQILITENNDNAYLLDLDLSVLGTDWDNYKTYTQNIRQEYKIYPDFIYNKGRKKVLKGFLERETLYFSSYFRNTHEVQARNNIVQEITLLQ